MTRLPLSKLIRCAIVIAIIAGACGSETVEPVEEVSPTDLVEQWLNAVDAGDTEEASRLSDPLALAVMVAAENNLSPQQLASVIDDGLPADLAAGYWATFSDSYRIISGSAISTLTVGNVKTFVAEGRQFASIEVGEGVIVATRYGEGRWAVDLVATVGPGFVRSIAALVEASDGADAPDLSPIVAPSLRAALVADAVDLSPVFRSELEALVAALTS